MRNTDLDLLTPSAQREVSDHLSEFGKGLVHASLESPVNALLQVGAKAVGSEHMPKLSISGAPAADSYAGMAGRIAGTAIDFYILNKVASPAFDKLGIANNTLGSNALRMGMTGAVYEGLLQESDPNSKNFLADRVKAAVVGGATFATMSAASSQVDKLGLFAVPEARTLLGSAVYGAVTGTAAGFVHTESSAILHQGRLATFDEMGADLAKYATFGAFFGAVGYASNQVTNKIRESNDSRPTSFRADGDHVVKSITRDAEGNIVQAVVTRPALDSNALTVRDTFTKYTDGHWGNMGKFENYRNMWGFKKMVSYMPHGSDITQLPDGTLSILRKQGVEFLKPNNQGRELIKFTSPEFKASETRFVMPHQASDEHGYRTYQKGLLKETFKGQDKGARVDLNENGSVSQVVVGNGRGDWLGMRQNAPGEWNVDRNGLQFNWKGKVTPIQDGAGKGGWTFSTKDGAEVVSLRPQTQPADLIKRMEAQFKLTETPTRNPVIKVDQSGAISLQNSSEPYYAKSFVNGKFLGPDSKSVGIKPGDKYQLWTDIGDRAPEPIGRILNWGLAADGKTPTLDGKTLSPGSVYQLKLPTEATSTLGYNEFRLLPRTH